MVLFIYLCSLTASLKTETNLMRGALLVVLTLLLGTAVFNQAAFYQFIQRFRLNQLYHRRLIFVIIFLILYLLIGLIRAMQIINKFEGPLKNKIRYE